MGAISVLILFMVGCSGTVWSGPATVPVTAESATTPTATPTTAKASPSSLASVASKADTRKAA